MKCSNKGTTKQKVNHMNIFNTIAQKKPNGFTVNLKGTPIEKGYVISEPITEGETYFGDKGLADALAKAVTSNRENVGIGGWVDAETGKFYWGCSIIEQDKEKALELGRKNNQIAIWDLNTMSEIRL